MRNPSPSFRGEPHRKVDKCKGILPSMSQLYQGCVENGTPAGEPLPLDGFRFFRYAQKDEYAIDRADMEEKWEHRNALEHLEGSVTC
jgi:hypothetical protein